MLVSTAVGDVSNPVAVGPKPTLSITAEVAGLAPVNAVIELLKITFPAVPAIAMVPTTSGVGRFTVPAAPTAS